MDRYVEYRDKLVGKTVKVKVIRVDYKGCVDINNFYTKHKNKVNY